MRVCLVTYWLSLAVWLSALVAGGIAAVHVFGRLPALEPALERFEAYPAAEHGRIAAGMIMSDLFFTTDLVQFVAVPLALITAVLQVTLFRQPIRRPANLVRLGCVVIAAGLFAYDAIAVAPAIYAELNDYWAAAEAGDIDGAAIHAEAMASRHDTAELVLQANLLLVLGALGASAVAFAPPPTPKGALEPPQLSA